MSDLKFIDEITPPAQDASEDWLDPLAEFDSSLNEIETMKHQLSLAHSAVSSITDGLTHLIDRAKYYGERPTRESLEGLRTQLNNLKKLLE